MLEKYAYLCNMHKCEKCSYPECSHTTDKRYRYISKESTEMRLVGSSNGINYYMEFVTRQGENQMNRLEWAKREIEIACNRERNDKDSNEWDYGVACYESAFKAYKSLMEDKHSGCSIGITVNILNRLVQCKPLTPIEDTPDIWHEVGFVKTGLVKNLQCSRMSSLWKDIYPDGTVKYIDNDRVIAYCIDHPTVGWHSGTIVHLIHEMFPITMPYCPESNPYKVYMYQGLTNPKNGDFDTIAVFYVIKPDGERVEINRYFDQTGETREITKEEYQEREKHFVNHGNEKFKII